MSNKLHVYLFKFITIDKILYLTNHHSSIQTNSIEYQPHSSIEIHQLSLRKNHANTLQIKGINHRLGINYNLLVHSTLKIHVGSIDLTQTLNCLQNKKYLSTFHCTQISYDHNNKFTAQYESVYANLSKNFTQYFSNECRAELGDSRCKVNLEKFNQICQIQTIQNNIITLNVQNLIYDYSGGRATVLYNNKIETYQIINSHEQTIILDSSIDISLLNCDIKLYVTCNKSTSDCIHKFNNIKNFRGEPYIT